MTQPLWFFGSRLTILADHTTTDGRYDPSKVTSLPVHKHRSIATHAIPNSSTCWKENSQFGQVKKRWR